VAAVTLQQVRKVYGNGHVGVAGANFVAGDGELLVLVGPSGCGKTTTLRMIAGLESMTSGTISIGDRVVNDIAPKDRDVAMVFQSYALYPHMTAAENLAFGLSVRGESRETIARRVSEAANLLGLADVLERRPRELSGGQRQRIALGRALVRQPQVFLLDEPLSNLDAKLRLSMRVEIARLHRRLGATMIYVTHDQIEAMTLGQRIVVFDRGEIQQIDTPMNLYRRPATLFVAGFLGSPAMNFFRGMLRMGEGPRLDCGADALSLAGANDAALRPYRDREVVVGIRPEDLLIAAPGAHGKLAARIDIVELVGNEMFVNVSAAGASLVVRAPPRELPSPAENIVLDYMPSTLHFFDGESGRRIDTGA